MTGRSAGFGWLSWTRSREGGLALVLVALVGSFALASPECRSLPVVLDQSRFWIEMGILGAAMLAVVAAGGIDLSVGSVLALSGVAMVRLHAEAGLPMAGCVAAGLCLGALAGALNGLLAACARIPDLVVTLATMVVFRGLAQLVARNRVYSDLPDGYLWIGEGTLGGVVPVPWAILAAWWLVACILLHRSRLGRHAFAMGASLPAARAAGVPVRRARLALYTLSGFAAALSAVITTARYGTARSDDGEGFELEAIACVVLGGASITGGRGGLAGVILATLVLGFLRTALVLSGVEELYRRIATGAILVAACAWNELLAGPGTDRSARPAGRRAG